MGTGERRRFLRQAASVAGVMLVGGCDQLSQEPPAQAVLVAACRAGGVPSYCHTCGAIGDRLEARGLVARRPDENDRRIKRIVLTPLGVEIHGRVRASMSAAPDAFKRLPLADQRALRDILQRALENMT